MENTIIEVVGGVAQVAILAIISLAAAWFRSKLQSDRLKNALSELEIAAASTVGELQQLTVERLKASRDDGKLTKDDISALGQESLRLVKQRMSVSAQNAIGAAGLDLQDLIRARVEAAVAGVR